MSTRQSVLDSITNRIQQDGVAPSLRQIQQDIGAKSTNTVSHHLAKLEESGAIKRESGKARAISVEHSQANPPIGSITE